MKSNNKITNSKSNIFARIRGNHYGESQSFTTIDEAITWVQQASRELVESGYTSVTFTIQGECHKNDYQGASLATQCCHSTSNESDIRINNSQNKKSTEMKETKKDLSAEFFSTAESDIKTIATATMEAAMSCKGLSDSEFEEAIMDVSNGLVSLRRSEDKIDFKYWEPYKKTHPSTDPCKKPLKAIEQTIIDTYRRGQSRTPASPESDASTSEISINNVLTSGCHNNTTVDELIKNIICTIQTHMYNNDMVRQYLSCHSAGLATEVSNMTGGVITCSISDTIVTLSCGSGVTSSLPIQGKTMNDIERDIRTILIRYLLHASISPRSRDAIACIIDLESLADMALIEDLIADSDAPLYSNSLL